MSPVLPWLWWMLLFWCTVSLSSCISVLGGRYEDFLRGVGKLIRSKKCQTGLWIHVRQNCFTHVRHTRQQCLPCKTKLSYVCLTCKTKLAYVCLTCQTKLSYALELFLRLNRLLTVHISCTGSNSAFRNYSRQRVCDICNTTMSYILEWFLGRLSELQQEFLQVFEIHWI